MFPDSVDLYVSDVPWDLVLNDSGRVIGEVYMLLPDPPPRRRQNKWGTGSISHRKNMQKQKSTELGRTC